MKGKRKKNEVREDARDGKAIQNRSRDQKAIIQDSNTGEETRNNRRNERNEKKNEVGEDARDRGRR